MRRKRAENFVSPLSWSASGRADGQRVDTGMVEGQCLLISVVTSMHFFELTAVFDISAYVCAITFLWCGPLFLLLLSTWGIFFFFFFKHPLKL